MRIKEDNFITQLKCRNKKALEYVIKTFGCMVKDIMAEKLHHLQSRQEDCMNEVFMGVWDNIHCFDESKNTFQNWIAAITRFKCIEYLNHYLCEVRHCSWEKIVVQEKDYAYELLLEQELFGQIQDLLDCMNKREQELFHELYINQKDMEQPGQSQTGNEEMIFHRISWAKGKNMKFFLQQGRENRTNG